MAYYIETMTGRYPVSEDEIKADYPNTSFGFPFVAPEEFEVVFPAPIPEHDTSSQYVVEIAPTLTDKGHWEQTFQVISYTEEEKANILESKRLSLIPLQVSPRQIRQALTYFGLRQQVEAAVAASDQDTKDWWEFSIWIERNHPMVSAMAQSLGVTERQLDDLFTYANTL